VVLFFLLFIFYSNLYTVNLYNLYTLHLANPSKTVIKMALKSAVEQSKNRLEIDNLLKEGKSPRFISDWLKNLKEGAESISHTAINNYKKKKFNVEKEAVLKYNETKSKELLDEASDKVVSDLKYCDNIIELADKIDLKVDHKNRITELDIKKLGLQAIKTKQDIFKQGGDDDNEFTIRIIGVDSDEDDNLEAQPETESEHQSEE
jgi:hypothetical protein